MRLNVNNTNKAKKAKKAKKLKWIIMSKTNKRKSAH